MKEKTFTVAGIEFIKFEEADGKVIVVAKDEVFRSVYGKNNNLSKSEILERLQTEILPKIEEEVGAENVLEFETDLLSLDGLDTYGKVKSKISIPTLDFYRKHARVFDKFKLDKYWWLATPWSTKEHYNNYYALCVSPDGDVYYSSYYGNFGVRPFLIFKSNIFES